MKGNNDYEPNTNVITPNRAVLTIVLTYLLYGVINFFYSGFFLPPIPYTSLFVFALALTLFIPPRSPIKKIHITLLIVVSLLTFCDPFFWNIFLSMQQIEDILTHKYFYSIPIIQLIMLFILIRNFGSYINYRFNFIRIIMLLSIVGACFAFVDGILENDGGKRDIGMFIGISIDISMLSLILMGVGSLFYLFEIRQYEYQYHNLLIVIVAIAFLLGITYTFYYLSPTNPYTLLE